MKDFNSILEEAFQNGEEALNACVPAVYNFYPADLSGKRLGDGEMSEDCGGAYIKNIQYNSEIYKFFKAKGSSNGSTGINSKFTLSNGICLSKDVYKGYTLSFPTNKIYKGQSHERYKAFYEAAAKVLKENGVYCSVRDYLT